jgi:F420-dependent oxidoreductase-like protein
MRNLRLGLMLGYWMTGPEDPIDLVTQAEDAGYDSVWTAEAYGSDCVSTLCWIGARTKRIKLGTGIMQMSARTPACVAMTAATIDHLSNGRLILGLGVSGPQVVEGWYGQPFPRPLGRTREFVHLVRAMLKREGPVSFAGEHYRLPYDGGSRLGKPLKLIVHPLRGEIPIYLAAEGP